MCNLFSTYFSILTPFFSSIDIFNSGVRSTGSVNATRVLAFGPRNP
jgi:hypothetical protein